MSERVQWSWLLQLEQRKVRLPFRMVGEWLLNSVVPNGLPWARSMRQWRVRMPAAVYGPRMRACHCRARLPNKSGRLLLIIIGRGDYYDGSRFVEYECNGGEQGGGWARSHHTSARDCGQW